MWLRSLRGCLGWKSPRCPRGDTERVANIVPNYFMRTCLLLDRQYCGDIWRNCPLEFVGPPQVKSTITFEARFCWTANERIWKILDTFRLIVLHTTRVNLPVTRISWRQEANPTRRIHPTKFSGYDANELLSRPLSSLA